LGIAEAVRSRFERFVHILRLDLSLEHEAVRARACRLEVGGVLAGLSEARGEGRLERAGEATREHLDSKGLLDAFDVLGGRGAGVRDREVDAVEVARIRGLT